MGELTSETTSQTELRARLTEQELADLNARRAEIRSANTAYLESHPEVRATLSDFMSAVLVAKPENVYEFARKHFSKEDEIQKNQLVTPLVICGPSGVGKGTLINMLFQEFPEHFGFSVSHTTRAPRPGEVHGVHYNFTNKEAFQSAIEEGKFLEYAHVHTNIYGTSVDAVRKVQRAGKICVLDIDVQGVQKIKTTEVAAHFLFIAPPSFEALESRLRARATESEKDLETRLGNARAEVEFGMGVGNFEKVVVNDVLEEAYQDLKAQLVSWYPQLAR